MSSDSKTKVDLGEDLLEETRFTLKQKKRDSIDLHLLKFPQDQNILDEIISDAKILFMEGWGDEAKQNLRRVLFVQPKNASAADLLKQIQSKELEDHLGSSPIQVTQKADSVRLDEGPTSLETLLKNDFKSDPPLMPLERLIELTSGNSIKDRMDIAIAMIEMEQWTLAIGLLERLSKDQSFYKQSYVLLAQCYVKAGQGDQSIILSEQFLRESELSVDEKIEILYWRARAFEEQKNYEEALRWYQQIAILQYDYRDVIYRMTGICQEGYSSHKLEAQRKKDD